MTLKRLFQANLEESVKVILQGPSKPTTEIIDQIFIFNVSRSIWNGDSTRLIVYWMAERAFNNV